MHTQTATPLIGGYMELIIVDASLERGLARGHHLSFVNLPPLHHSSTPPLQSTSTLSRPFLQAPALRTDTGWPAQACQASQAAHRSSRTPLTPLVIPHSSLSLFHASLDLEGIACHRAKCHASHDAHYHGSQSHSPENLVHDKTQAISQVRTARRRRRFIRAHMGVAGHDWPPAAH